jgi:ribosomal protein L11 methyltransferase
VTAPWWRLDVHCPPNDGDLVAGWLVHETGQGVEQPAPDHVVAVLASRAEARRLARDLTSRFPGVNAPMTAITNVDWSTRWREGIAPRTFGRLTLAPSWIPAPPPPGGTAVIIDPGAAFGSGEHGSTRGALTLLERWLQPGGLMLDFGSGSGILVIAAAALGASHAVGIDIDPGAQAVAEANAVLNGVAERTTFLTGDAEGLGPLAGPASMVCSNILCDANVRLLPTVRRALTAGGVAILAGMERDESSLLLPALGVHRLEPLDEIEDAGWWSVAVRPR